MLQGIEKLLNFTNVVNIDSKYLTDYVKSKQYVEIHTTLSMLRADARREFYHLLDFDLTDDNLRKVYIANIRSVDYSKIEDITSEDQWLYTYFTDELVHALNLDFDKNRKEYVIERQVSPPLEVYDKPDIIKPSGRDFGFLFE